MNKNFIYLKFLGLVFMGSSLMAQISNRPNDQLVKQTLMESSHQKMLSSEDVSYELTDFHSSTKNGIQHIYLRQKLNGLEIVGTESSIHISSSGKVANVNNKFLNSIQKRGNEVGNSPKMDAKQALTSVASQLGYALTKSVNTLSQDFSANQNQLLSDGGISKSAIPAKLMYFLKEDGTIALVWEISIESINQTEWYNVWVDASNGQIVDKANWISSCGFEHNHDSVKNHSHSHDSKSVQKFVGPSFAPNALTASYMVFAMPIESPYFGDRTLVLENDVANLTASPFGWHDTNGVSGPEYTTTRGNNVNAYEDGDNYGFQPDGGTNLEFEFPFNPNYSQGDQSESAAITNLFYWNNIIHDVFYEYGFDEASGNFQQNNYGKGGIGNDYVLAEAQDGSGTCNANFATPPDGQNPRMQMYVCGNKDGDFDNVVITHEYGHGISIRLTGGASNSNCLNNQEQMGEGWSDFFGLILTMKEGDVGSTAKPIGTWLFGQGPNGQGIRTYPYSTNMNTNPHTYNSIKTEAAPHGVGSVWAAMLWDMTWDLVEEYGFDEDIYNGTGGNNIALQLVMEALKLQPCSPGFVDGRDAILQADQLLFNGANECLIWDAFARRGLGVSATQGSTGSKTDGTESFDTPSAPAEMVAPDDVCVDRGIMTGLTGGTPIGGVYSGPGVTDDGNGKTFTFDPEVAGIGIHTITYSKPATACAAASSSSDEIEVTEGLMVTCPSDITVNASDDTCSAMVDYTMPEGYSTCAALNTENFDGVSTPNLPEEWTTTSEVGSANAWVTVNTKSVSAPNSAFAVNKNSRSLSSLVSPTYEMGDTGGKLTFELYYQTESNYDGVVLEYSANGGSWKDILIGGGTFVSGGYNSTISSWYNSPIAGRGAWSGNSGEFVMVEIDLNSSLNNKNVQFRWRMGSDSSQASEGVWLDNVSVEGVFSEGPTTVQTAGLASGSEFPVGTTLNTFEITDSSGAVKTCSFEVTVTDSIAPTMVCPDDFTVAGTNGTYVLPDYWASELVTATDNCSTLEQKTQSPAAGTELADGTHTIEFSVKDSAGNTSTCSFDLTVDSTMGTIDSSFGNGIQMFPNPSDNFVTISTSQKIVKVIFKDLSGKRIMESKWDSSMTENTFSIKHLPTGTYLVQIIGEKQSVVKKLIKK